jgi:hypothetical protein
MKDTYTIQERKVYDVYKNGSLDKTFPTLEKAEEYKRKKEEKENGAKNCDFKTIITVVLFTIYIHVFIIAMVLQKCNNSDGNFIVLCCELILGVFILCLLIKPSVDKSNYSFITRLLSSIGTNVLFFNVPIMFTFYDTESLKGSPVLISTLIIFILTFILLSILIKINKGDDTSLLKATNLFIAFIFTAIQLLIGDYFLIGYYILLPLLLAQSLYELFDGKSKANDENKATPIQSQEEVK